MSNLQVPAERKKELSGMFASEDKWASTLEIIAAADCSVQYLRVFHNEDKHTLRVAEALKSNQSVTQLDIGSLDVQGAAALAKVLATHLRIQQLCIEGFGSSAAAIKLADGLSSNRILENLALVGSGPELFIPAAAALGPGKQLQQLRVTKGELTAESGAVLAAGLKSDACLKHLDLGRCMVEAAALLELGKGLAAHPVLARLDLTGCGLRDEEGGRVLAHMLGSAGLTRLDLSNNPLGDAGAKALAPALATSRLLHLGLQECRLGREGGEALAAGLAQNINLQTLLLQNNEISIEGAAALANVVASHPALRELNLEDNRIRGSGLIPLVSSTSPLTSLELSCNLLGCDGASEVSESLKSNCRLIHLGLKQCGIGEKGAMALADCLKSNEALQSLILDSNRIGNKGAEALLDGVRNHQCLTTWKMDQNRIMDKTLKKIVADISSAIANRVSRPPTPPRIKTTRSREELTESDPIPISSRPNSRPNSRPTSRAQSPTHSLSSSPSPSQPTTPSRADTSPFNTLTCLPEGLMYFPAPHLKSPTSPTSPLNPVDSLGAWACSPLQTIASLGSPGGLMPLPTISEGQIKAQALLRPKGNHAADGSLRSKVLAQRLRAVTPFGPFGVQNSAADSPDSTGSTAASARYEAAAAREEEAARPRGSPVAGTEGRDEENEQVEAMGVDAQREGGQAGEQGGAKLGGDAREAREAGGEAGAVFAPSGVQGMDWSQFGNSLKWQSSWASDKMEIESVPSFTFGKGVPVSRQESTPKFKGWVDPNLFEDF